MTRPWLWFIPFCVMLLLVCCAAPPLTLYTLALPPAPVAAAPLGAKPVVVALTRVMVPDELDTEEIVFRDGSILRRSQKGRWATRLSAGITGRLTSRLAERRPDLLFTDRPLSDSPSYRLLINIGRLDVNDRGVAVLDADWLIAPTDAAQPTRRQRAGFSVEGKVASDQDVVTLVGDLVDQLAGAINLSALR
jgi:uncharacterized lipoprotein YmbA